MVFHKVYCLRRRDVSFVRDNEQLVRRKIHDSNKVEVRFKRSNGDQRRKGAVLVRTRTGRRGERERGVSSLLVEHFRLCVNGDSKEEAPLMSPREEDDWEVWSRGRAIQCLRDGIASVGERWIEEGRGAGARLILEQFVLPSGRIGGATRRLAAKGVKKDEI